jgi:hypothetical protein
MEVRYLKWVKSLASTDSVILGNGAEHLILASEVTKLPIYTNAFYVSRKMTLDATLPETWEKADFEHFPKFIEQNATSTNERLIILDHDVKAWEYYLSSGASQSYPKNKYQLKEVAFSPYLNRKIYTMVMKK